MYGSENPVQASETTSDKGSRDGNKVVDSLEGEFRGSALEEPEPSVCQVCSERADNSVGSTPRQ